MQPKSSNVSEDEIRRPRGVQREDVWAAADAVLLAGEKPTIERVRQHLGTGSPNTVGPLLEQWFKQLGRRIQDPGAFAAPAGVPDPVLQAAQHFWEMALTQTRGDFEERLREGLADAVSSLNAEKERAELASAAAYQANAKAMKLQSDLAEQAQLLQKIHEELAAERARLHEVRTTLAAEKERSVDERQRAAEQLNDIRQQLVAAIDRADAADRRVAMELERERTARAKAERQVEMLQNAVDAAREAQASSHRQAQQHLEAARKKEELLLARLASAEAELATHKRLSALRSLDESRAAQMATAMTDVVELKASLERLTSLIDTSAMRQSAKRKRVAKPTPRNSITEKSGQRDPK